MLWHGVVCYRFGCFEWVHFVTLLEIEYGVEVCSDSERQRGRQATEGKDWGQCGDGGDGNSSGGEMVTVL